jgi:hypothetical protein
MTSRVFKVRVASVDRQSGFASLVDPNEINDVVPYKLFIPAYFGGATNPWPKAGEELLIRYDGSALRNDHNRITDAWRPNESVQEYEAPAASFL